MKKEVNKQDMARHMAEVLGACFSEDFTVTVMQSDQKEPAFELTWIDGPPVPLVAQVLKHAFKTNDGTREDFKLFCYRGYSQWRFEGARAMLAAKSEMPELLLMSMEEIRDSDIVLTNTLGEKKDLSKAFVALLDSMMFEWDVPAPSEYLNPNSPMHWRNK